MKHSNPWPGPLPYEIGSKYELYGRNVEKGELAELIQNNVFLTLYGKSGIGKTSLLNKGVIPLLGDDYVPISIRLRDVENYIECICENVANEKKENVICHSDMNDEVFLWNWFKELENIEEEKKEEEKKRKEYVVILDQFEEILREKHKEDIDKSPQQLNSYGMPIQESKQRKDKVDILLSQFFYMIRTVTFYNSDYICHFLISIREDDLYLLEDRIDENYLYDLKNYRYRLRSLTLDGAREVVKIPGKDFFNEGEINDIANKIVDEVKNESGGEINSMILSLLCSRIYDENYSRYLEKEEKIPLEAVEKTETKAILEKYYDEAISSFTDEEKEYIGKFVDEYNRRITIPKGKFKFPQIIDKQIHPILHENRDNYELIHDSFCEIVKKWKKNWELKRVKEKRNFIASLFIGTMAIILFVYSGVAIQWMSETIYHQGIWTVDEINNNQGVGRIDSVYIDKTPLFSLNNRKSLKKARIAMPTSTIEIANCSQLSDLYFEDSVDSVKGRFSGCNKLTYLSFGKNVRYISKESFRYISSLNGEIQLIISPENPYLAISPFFSGDSICPYIHYKGNPEHPLVGPFWTTLIKSQIALNKGVDSIIIHGEVLRSNGRVVNSITPKDTTLTSFDRLKSLPKSLERISFKADGLCGLWDEPFRYHPNLKEIIFHKYANITPYSFANCSQLQSITMPESVSMGGTSETDGTGNGFAFCQKLNDIRFPASSDRYREDSITGIIFFDNYPIIFNKLKVPSCSIPNTSFSVENGIVFNKNEVIHIKDDLINRKWKDGKGIKYYYKEYAEKKDTVGVKHHRYIISPNSECSNIEFPMSYNYPIDYGLYYSNGLINEIHLPIVDPSKICNFTLNYDHVENVTLYVPYGSLENYINDGRFDNFYDIKEDGLIKRVFQTVLSIFYNTPMWYYRLLVAISIVVLIVVYNSLIKIGVKNKIKIILLCLLYIALTNFLLLIVNPIFDISRIESLFLNTRNIVIIMPWTIVILMLAIILISNSHSQDNK